MYGSTILPASWARAGTASAVRVRRTGAATRHVRIELNSMNAQSGEKFPDVAEKEAAMQPRKGAIRSAKPRSVHAGSPARRKKRRGDSHQRQENGDGGERQRVGGADTVEKTQEPEGVAKILQENFQRTPPRSAAILRPLTDAPGQCLGAVESARSTQWRRMRFRPRRACFGRV